MKTAAVILLLVGLFCGCKPSTPPPNEPIHWEYSYLKINPPGGSYKSEIIILPRKDEKIWVSDPGEVMDHISQYGWEVVWISGDGNQLLVKRPFADATGRIISTEELK